jgi:hypothetical protein
MVPMISPYLLVTISKVPTTFSPGFGLSESTGVSIGF